jgi:hypothetical protein
MRRSGTGSLSCDDRPHDSEAACSRTDAGVAVVLVCSGGGWTVPVTASDRFGRSLAFGGSSTAPTLAVGTPGDDEPGKANCGAVYVVELDADGAATASTRLVATVPQLGAGLGASVSVDDAGTTVASGSPLASASAGEVTVWTNAGSWTAATLVPPVPAANEQFGASVSLGGAGDVLVAGSPLATIGGIAGRGSATVFTLTAGAWSTYDRLTLPATGSTASQFGRSVSFAGGTILVGAPKHDGKGTVREFMGPP